MGLSSVLSSVFSVVLLSLLFQSACAKQIGYKAEIGENYLKLDFSVSTSIGHIRITPQIKNSTLRHDIFLSANGDFTGLYRCASAMDIKQHGVIYKNNEDGVSLSHESCVGLARYMYIRFEDPKDQFLSDQAADLKLFVYSDIHCANAGEHCRCGQKFTRAPDGKKFFTTYPSASLVQGVYVLGPSSGLCSEPVNPLPFSTWNITVALENERRKTKPDFKTDSYYYRCYCDTGYTYGPSNPGQFYGSNIPVGRRPLTGQCPTHDAAPGAASSSAHNACAYKLNDRQPNYVDVPVTTTIVVEKATPTKTVCEDVQGNKMEKVKGQDGRQVAPIYYPRAVLPPLDKNESCAETVNAGTELCNDDTLKQCGYTCALKAGMIPVDSLTTAVSTSARAIEENYADLLKFHFYNTADTTGFDSGLLGLSGGQSGQSGQSTGFDSGSTGSQSGQSGQSTGFDSGSTGFDSGQSGFDSGSTGFDSASQSGQSGQSTGFDSGSTGFDSGN